MPKEKIDSTKENKKTEETRFITKKDLKEFGLKTKDIFTEEEQKEIKKIWESSLFLSPRTAVLALTPILMALATTGCNGTYNIPGMTIDVQTKPATNIENAEKGKVKTGGIEVNVKITDNNEITSDDVQFDSNEITSNDVVLDNNEITKDDLVQEGVKELKIISGKIVDNDTGEAIDGAVITSSKEQVASQGNGSFKISTDGDITITAGGYIEQTFPAGSDIDNMTLELTPIKKSKKK